MTTSPTCQKCGHVHGSNCAPMVGRFTGGRGYAANIPHAVVRATRTEAEEDYCQWLQRPSGTGETH